MNARPFLDTNILIYAFASNDRRGKQAEALVAAGGAVSVQVLNEFVNVCRNKVRLDWIKIENALQIVKDLSAPPLPLTLDIHEEAVLLARDHALAFYDALIVATAMKAACPVLYTEDMQHGRRIGDLLISNPFLD
jgi:predicted nucleic acid-binding protein